MKQMYFILMVLFIAHSSATAKEEIEGMTTGIVSGGGGFPHFTPQAPNANGSNPQSFRLVARTNARYNGGFFGPIDSTNYLYSKGRGGLVNPDAPTVDEFVLFDDSYTYIYNNVINAYDNKLYRNQTFDNNNLVKTLTYSSWRSATSTFKDSARYLYNYIPGSNKIAKSSLELSQGGGMWIPHDASLLAYSGNNVVDVDSRSYKATFTYDTHNNITSIEDKVLDHATGALNNNQHKIYTYDASNMAVSYTLQNWDPATLGWVNYKYWEYSYTGTLLTSSLEHNWNGSSWDIYAKHLYTYINGVDKKEEQILLWDNTLQNFVNATNEVWEYDSNGNVMRITTANWDRTSGSWVYGADNTQIRFYYEYYAPTTVNKVSGNNNIGLYPIPATSAVTVNLKWQSPQAFNMVICNMTGQVVMNWQEEPVRDYAKQINVADLPDGNYIIKAAGSNETLIGKLMIKK